MKKITVIDVLRDMNIEITPHLSWSVGARVREMWEKKFGNEPEKQLRQKTSGGGSHCFAIYPSNLRPDIEKIIRAHQTEAQKQGNLFGG